MLEQYDLKREAAQRGVARRGIGGAAVTAYSWDVVFDPQNWVNTWITQYQSVRQVAELTETVATLKQQLDTARRAYAAVTSISRYGKMLESSLEQERRRWLPNDWDSAMQVADRVARGEVPGGIFAAQAGRIEGQFKRLGEREFIGYERRQEYGDAYRRVYGTAIVSSTIARGVYNDHGYQTARIEALGNEVDQTPDLKASVDLQNRLQVETLLQLQRANEQKAVEMELASARAQQELSERAAGERFLARKNVL